MLFLSLGQFATEAIGNSYKDKDTFEGSYLEPTVLQLPKYESVMKTNTMLGFEANSQKCSPALILRKLLKRCSSKMRVEAMGYMGFGQREHPHSREILKDGI